MPTSQQDLTLYMDLCYIAKGCLSHDLQRYNSLSVLQFDLQGKKVRVGGIAKGSGMIHPNMATLLSVITTDASVEPGLWRSMLQHGVSKSFNQVRYQALPYVANHPEIRISRPCTGHIAV